jgi:hypothetical protein
MDMPRVPVLEDNPRDGDSASAEEKKTKKVRKLPAPGKGGNTARYFLAAPAAANDASSLALGQEYSNEDEVLVASFQKGIKFYRVETWSARAEKKGRNMVLRKQS